MRRTLAILALLLAAACSGPAPEITPAAPTTSVGYDARLTYAHQVTKAFRDAGIKLGPERDNTKGNCPLYGCTQYITTDLVTVVSFETPEKGWDYTKSLEPNAYQAGSVALSYLGQQTSAADRKKLEEILRGTVK